MQANVFAPRHDLDRLFDLLEVRTRASKHVVTIGSKVEYVDLRSGVRSQLTLVLPWEADPKTAKVSVLAPAGVALYGVRAGETLHWHTPLGREHDWKVIEVRAPE